MAVLDRGQALQQVRTQYVTSVRVQVPRDIGRVREQVLQEATLAGSAFYYGWDVKGRGGKSRVEGPSIDCAMSLVRAYGNCVLETNVSADESHFTFEAALIDLESGTTIKRLFRQRKSQSLGGKMDSDRAEDIVFQIGQSKAGRNVVVRAMPGWLIEQAIEAAKAGEVKRIDVKTLPETRQRAAKFFASHGVDIKRIENKLEKPLDKWMAEDIVELRGMMTALKEGRATVYELFPTEGVSETKTTNETKKENPLSSGKVAEGAKSEAGAGETPPVKQALTEAEKPNEGKTKKTKKTEEKRAEPPAPQAIPEGSKTTEQPPVTTSTPVSTESVGPRALSADTFEPAKIKMGIRTCPTEGKRPGKYTHSKWCMGSCEFIKTCSVLRADPPAAT